MGCKSRDESEICSVRDALLFTTMCIIGLPVEVQVKDGSIYSGIFHTACFDNDYGIVLKKATITTKGRKETNLANEVVIDTLVVLSADLVQVVAKGHLLPAEGIVGNLPSDDVGAVTGSIQPLECLESELRMLKSTKAAPEKFAAETILISRSRSSDHNKNKSVTGLANKHTGNDLSSNVEKGQSKGEFPAKSLGSALEGENGKVDGVPSAKIEEASALPVGLVDEGLRFLPISSADRQVGKDQSQEKKNEPYQKFGPRKDNAIYEVQYSCSANANLPQLKSLSREHVDISSKMSSDGPSCGGPVTSLVKPDAHDFERPASADMTLDVPSPTTIVNMSSQLCTRQSASQTSSMAPKDAVSNASSKEFKLNPGAKTFLPMFSVPKSAAPPAPATVASMEIIPNSHSIAPVAVASPDIGISPFAPRSSLPIKFVPYNNLVASNGDIASQYFQPIVGHVGSRLQPVRYTGQYNPIQAGPAYVHPSSQAVVVGRLGQLFYMHPISHDMIQGSTIPAPVRPQLTPPQVHLPKHQGSAAAQALPVCVTQPPFVVSGQQPYAMASNIPFSQPTFPSVRPVPVPGANGHFNSKYL